jgi:hypothetical protein
MPRVVIELRQLLPKVERLPLTGTLKDAVTVFPGHGLLF